MRPCKDRPPIEGTIIKWICVLLVLILEHLEVRAKGICCLVPNIAALVYPTRVTQSWNISRWSSNPSKIPRFLIIPYLKNTSAEILVLPVFWWCNLGGFHLLNWSLRVYTWKTTMVGLLFRLKLAIQLWGGRSSYLQIIKKIWIYSCALSTFYWWIWVMYSAFPRFFGLPSYITFRSRKNCHQGKGRLPAMIVFRYELALSFMEGWSIFMDRPWGK